MATTHLPPLTERLRPFPLCLLPPREKARARPPAPPGLFHMGPCPLLMFVFSAFGSKNSLPSRRRKRPMPFGRPLDAEPALRVILIL